MRTFLFLVLLTSTALGEEACESLDSCPQGREDEHVSLLQTKAHVMRKKQAEDAAAKLISDAVKDPAMEQNSEPTESHKRKPTFHKQENGEALAEQAGDLGKDAEEHKDLEENAADEEPADEEGKNEEPSKEAKVDEKKESPHVHKKAQPAENKGRHPSKARRMLQSESLHGVKIEEGSKTPPGHGPPPAEEMPAAEEQEIAEEKPAAEEPAPAKKVAALEVKEEVNMDKKNINEDAEEEDDEALVEENDDGADVDENDDDATEDDNDDDTKEDDAELIEESNARRCIKKCHTPTYSWKYKCRRFRKTCGGCKECRRRGMLAQEAATTPYPSKIARLTNLVKGWF